MLNKIGSIFLSWLKNLSDYLESQVKIENSPNPLGSARMWQQGESQSLGLPLLFLLQLYPIYSGIHKYKCGYPCTTTVPWPFLGLHWKDRPGEGILEVDLEPCRQEIIDSWWFRVWSRKRSPGLSWVPPFAPTKLPFYGESYSRRMTRLEPSKALSERPS